MQANTKMKDSKFYHIKGQNAHVGGQAAAASKEHADKMIFGGWENGVLKHFQVMEVLSAAI